MANPSPDKGSVAELLRIGGQMANVLYGLQQNPGDALDDDVFETMDKLRRQWEAVSTTPPSPSTGPRKFHVKDHVVREVVNSLRDTALEFHGHQSLRERLAAALDPLLPSPSTAPEVFDPAKRTGRQLMDQWNAGAHEVAERDAFEAWAREPIRAEKLPLDRWPTNDGYKDTRTYIAFYGWKSGRAALASRPAEVDDEGLLSECKRFLEDMHAMPIEWTIKESQVLHQKLATAEQYRQGQRDAVAADRARRGSQP